MFVQVVAGHAAVLMDTPLYRYSTRLRRKDEGGLARPKDSPKLSHGFAPPPPGPHSGSGGAAPSALPDRSGGQTPRLPTDVTAEGSTAKFSRLRPGATGLAPPTPAAAMVSERGSGGQPPAEPARPPRRRPPRPASTLQPDNISFGHNRC